MKISNSKKQLAKIIHEEGGWVDGAAFYCQDRDGEIFPYNKKPSLPRGGTIWHHSGVISGGSIKRETPIKNWHQTILSRDEYSHLYPAPDAMRPEDFGAVDDCGLPHGSKPTIEQLAADYRNRKDFADRKQQEADAAKADAEAKLAELVAAGKALGLVLSVAEPEPEPGITDWRDLLVGDEVECVRTPYGASCTPCMFGVVTEVTASGVRARFDASLSGRADGSWFSTQGGCFRFIRRPAKGAANA